MERSSRQLAEAVAEGIRQNDRRRSREAVAVVVGLMLFALLLIGMRACDARSSAPGAGGARVYR